MAILIPEQDSFCFLTITNIPKTRIQATTTILKTSLIRDMIIWNDSIISKNNKKARKNVQIQDNKH